MGSLNFNDILTLAGGISVISGAVYAVMKILREIRKAKKESAEKILEEAKEYDNELKAKLENRIDILELDLHNLKSSVVKDIKNLKENHAIELANLADKIQVLRNDLQSQHASVLDLLTQLVKNTR